MTLTDELKIAEKKRDLPTARASRAAQVRKATKKIDFILCIFGRWLKSVIKQSLSIELRLVLELIAHSIFWQTFCIEKRLLNIKHQIKE